MEAPERRPAEGLGEVGTRDRELCGPGTEAERGTEMVGRQQTQRGTETKEEG